MDTSEASLCRSLYIKCGLFLANSDRSVGYFLASSKKVWVMPLFIASSKKSVGYVTI